MKQLNEVVKHRTPAQPPKTLDDLECAYIDAAAELQSKQAGLQNYTDELNAFLNARDALKAHPEFLGRLPQTYFSGGELDPEGLPSPNWF